MPSRSPQAKGLTLFELLIAISLLGILFGLVLPMALRGSDFNSARDRRNAQELASICTCAQVAGLNFVIDGDLRATISNIRLGGSPTEGVFKGRRFVVSGIRDEDAVSCQKYLSLENGNLVYQHDPKS